ncbi:Ti-type conjugative transfer relaxase TraA [Candidatus Jidaibacter acanthamoebae]|uniref:Ti-type conjugative transfer relaxase TraA n=1 Tax=Candidatus Jidaibacter acanthamoebae TaxID=86105 RepID=UPI00057E6AD2|nr:Ti-type conjugative transfer relaxase TraA [Candidatus Jidaibacter acanthamoeba]
MAIYYFHAGVKGRGGNKSPRVVASAAYKSASRLVEKVYDKETGQVSEITHDYTNKKGVVFSQIFLPANAPLRFKNAEVLWNEVVYVENRKDSQFCRDFTIALPKEFNTERNIELVKEYVEKVFVERGIIAHASIHMDDENNPHAHIMATMRDIKGEGFGDKNRKWNEKSAKLYEREQWAEVTNEHLARYGFIERITHLSYKDRGLDIEPTIHEGYHARKIEERGGVAEVCEVNREIKLKNIDKFLKDPMKVLDVKFFSQATFTDNDIEKAVHDLTEGQSDAYNQIINRIYSCSEIVKLEQADLKGNSRYSFKDYIEQEELMFNNAKVLAESNFVKKYKADYDDIYQKCKGQYGANDEQSAAVAHIISSNKRLNLVVGRAGTGKTHKVLKPVADYYKQEGYKVTGIALAGIAAESLNSDVGVESYTIHSWLNKTQIEPLTKNDVIILDEAGMVDVPQMAKIVEKVKRAGAKLIGAGDHAQLAPVGKGAAFRGLVDKEGAQLVSKVYRQREGWQQEATEALSEWNVEKAMRAYADAQYIVWSDKKEESIERLARDYVENYEKNGRGQITTSFKNSDIKQLNKATRELLILRGNLEFRKHYNLVGTDKLGKEIRFNKELGVGEEVIFKKTDYDSYNVKNGSRGKVIELKDKSVVVKINGRDREVEINLKEYNSLEYAYALTIHAVQGLGEEKVNVLASRGFNANLAYVGLSRFRQSMKIYADKENLKDLHSLTSIMSRDGGSDLVTDYKGIRSEKADTVFRYMGSAEKVRNLSAEINEWCREEEVECFEHKKWGELMQAVSQREEYAKSISEDLSGHRVYIKQAGLYQNTIKIHAGLRKGELSTLEKKEYEDFARYALLVESKDKESIKERNRLADSVLRARAEKRYLYNTWAEELGIKTEGLYKHALAYAAKDYKSSELFAKSFARLEKLHFGSKLREEGIRGELYSLYEDIKANRQKREASIAAITYTEGKITSEEKGIAKLTHEITDRELYLKRAYRDEKIVEKIDKLAERGNYSVELLNKIGQVKEGYKVSDIISHLEIRDLLKRNIGLAKEVIDQYQSSHDYRNALYTKEDTEKKLGRFTHDFDFKQIENAVKAAQGRSQEYEKALSVFTAPTVYEWSGFTNERGELKEEAIFRDLLVEKSAKEIVRVENEAIRGSFYRELIAIKNDADNSSTDNNSSELEEEKSYSEKIKEQINHKYTKADKWISTYKTLLEEDKKYTHNLSYEDVVKRKKLQELIIGHKTALKEVFGQYKPHEIRLAGKKDLLELGLYKERSFKAYIKVSEKEENELGHEIHNLNQEARDKEKKAQVNTTSFLEKGIHKEDNKKVQSKKEEWRQQYSQERHSTRDIYRNLYDRLPSLLPEFGFRAKGNAYVSTTTQKADGSLGNKAGKVHVYANNPGVLIDYTRGNVSIWDYVKDNYMPSASKAEVRAYLLEEAGLSEKSERIIHKRPQPKAVSKVVEEKAKVDTKLMEAILTYAKVQLVKDKNPVYDYLSKERGYSKEVIQNMELGYIADKKDMSKYLRANGWHNNKIKEAYKLTHYIGQSHQLIIPFKGKNGEVIGIAGRDLHYTESSSFGKYMYSKELERSKTLLNIHNVKGLKEAVIVEGMLDCLNAHANGIKGVLALGGTSLNEEQIKLLALEGIKSITLCLDNDNAGLEAGVRILDKLKTFAPDINVRYAKLPDNIKDPDQLIKEYGKEALERVIADAVPVKGISTLTDMRYAESLRSVMSEGSIRDTGIIKDNRLSLPENIGEMITEYRTLHKSVKQYEECSKVIEGAKEEDYLKIGIAYKQQEQIEQSGTLEKYRELKEKITPNIKGLPNELRNAYYHPDKNIDEEEYKAQAADIKQAHELAQNKVDKDLEKFEILDVQIKYYKGLESEAEVKKNEIRKASGICNNIDTEISNLVKEVGDGIKESLSDTTLAERQLEGRVYEALIETLSEEGIKLKGTAVLGIKNKLRIKAQEMLNKTIANLNEVVKLKKELHKQYQAKDLLSRELNGIHAKQSKYDIVKKQELYTSLDKTLGEKFERLNEEYKTRYILAGGGKDLGAHLTARHQIHMKHEGKVLVDKITNNKTQKHNEWIKEPNIDKLTNPDKQKDNIAEQSLSNSHSRNRDIGLEM